MTSDLKFASSSNVEKNNLAENEKLKLNVVSLKTDTIKPKQKTNQQKFENAPPPPSPPNPNSQDDEKNGGDLIKATAMEDLTTEGVFQVNLLLLDQKFPIYVIKIFLKVIKDL